MVVLSARYCFSLSSLHTGGYSKDNSYYSYSFPIEIVYKVSGGHLFHLAEGLSWEIIDYVHLIKMEMQHNQEDGHFYCQVKCSEVHIKTYLSFLFQIQIAHNVSSLVKYRSVSSILHQSLSVWQCCFFMLSNNIKFFSFMNQNPSSKILLFNQI